MATAKRGSAIQGKNREYEVGKGKPPKEHQFKPNDPRINRHGRPKNHDQLRVLIQRIAGEAVADKPEWSQIELMLRAMMKSKSAEDRKQILEHGWGKPKDEVEHSGNITLTVVYDEPEGSSAPAAPAATAVHSEQGEAEGDPGRAPQR